MRRLVLLVLGLALLPACDEPVTYSYFVIQTRLDRATVDFSILDRITACAVLAQTPVREDSADMRCRRHAVMNELGAFEYTTSLTSGAIKFVLIANDFNGQLLARGETAPLDIVRGKTVMAELVATAVPGAKPQPEPEPDAGAPATPDAGTTD
jgi:hypothetical protein